MRHWAQSPRAVRVTILVGPLALLAVAVSLIFQPPPTTTLGWIRLIAAAVVGAVVFAEALTAIHERLPAPKRPLIDPASDGELLIIVARFSGPDQLDPQHYIAGRLESDLAVIPSLKDKVRIALYPETIGVGNDEAETQKARVLAEECSALLFIWGGHDLYHIRAHYFVNAASDLVPKRSRIPERYGLPSQLDAFVLYVQVELPQTISYLSMFTIGQMFYFRSEWAEAEQLLDAALNSLPSDPGYAVSRAALHFYRGSTLICQHEYERAIADFDLALELVPQVAGALNNRGLAYAYRGELNLAIADFDHALELGPHDAETLSNRGLAYAQRGEFDPAIADFDHALELAPQDSGTLNNRGNAYAQRGEFDLAIADFDHALGLSPQDSDTLTRRGDVYARRGEYELAIADFDHALALSPQDARILNNRGLAHAQRGEYDLAIADFDDALEFAPQDSVILNNRGLAYAYRGEYDLAIADFDHALELAPTNARILNNRGLAHIHQGRYVKAIDDFHRSSALCPDEGATCYYMARAQALDGTHRLALTWLERASVLTPSAVSWRDAVLHDPAFATLRDTPEFATLLARHYARGGSPTIPE